MKNNQLAVEKTSEIQLVSVKKIQDIILQNSIWLFLVICLIFFSFSSEYFLTVTNLTNVLVQGSFIGLLAIGMTLCIINGNIDLTVGAVLGLAASLAVGLQAEYGIIISILAALTAGLLLGLLNGVVTVFSGVNAFIVTLGGMIGIRGLVFVYTGEQSFFATDMRFIEFNEIIIGSTIISLISTLFIVLILFFQWFLSRTVHGRDAYAIGGNLQAAENAGIRVKKHIIINFAISGFLAAVAGVLLASRMGSSTPNLGNIYELWTIIAVVLGGTRLQGGSGSMWKTLGGVLTLAVIRNGLNLMNVQSFWVLIILGSVLILALFIDKLVGQKM
jgi:ribose/xylose/arabinose/galactoside ABC-type transport system permease subunit